MKLKTNKLLNQIILALLGCILLGFGIGWNVKIGIGGDSLSSLYSGLNKVTGLSVGTITALINLLFVVLSYILYKKNVGIATILFIFVSKWPIDFATTYFISSDSLIISIIYCTLSVACIALGAELFIFSNLGADAYNAFCMAIGKKLKHEVKFVYIRWFFDGSILILSYFLGGNIGVGTIISFALSGTFMKLIESVLSKFIEHE